MDLAQRLAAVRTAATLFWCDAEAVIRRAQRAVLAGLPGR